MAVYTVHQPPLRKGETAPDPDGFLFVRDGFYFWAFLLGPVWMAWRRLWLLALLFVVFALLLEFTFQAIAASMKIRALAAFLVAFLVGLEAGSLQRWTLARRGWKNVGVVVADDIESAERRFFASWTARTPTAAPTARPASDPKYSRPMSPSLAAPLKKDAQDVIGLFPQPDRPR
jgi:hypothetical protein